MNDELVSLSDRPSVQTKPRCLLSGRERSARSTIGAVRRALRNAGRISEAQHFLDRAWAAESHDELLRLATEYCDVT